MYRGCVPESRGVRAADASETNGVSLHSGDRSMLGFCLKAGLLSCALSFSGALAANAGTAQLNAAPDTRKSALDGPVSGRAIHACWPWDVSCLLQRPTGAVSAVGSSMLGSVGRDDSGTGGHGGDVASNGSDNGSGGGNDGDGGNGGGDDGGGNGNGDNGSGGGDDGPGNDGGGAGDNDDGGDNGSGEVGGDDDGNNGIGNGDSRSETGRPGLSEGDASNPGRGGRGNAGGQGNGRGGGNQK